MTTLMPPATIGHRAYDVYPAGPNGDPEKARELLGGQRHVRPAELLRVRIAPLLQPLRGHGGGLVGVPSGQPPLGEQQGDSGITQQQLEARLVRVPGEQAEVTQNRTEWIADFMRYTGRQTAKAFNACGSTRRCFWDR